MYCKCVKKKKVLQWVNASLYWKLALTLMQNK